MVKVTVFSPKRSPYGYGKKNHLLRSTSSDTITSDSTSSVSDSSSDSNTDSSSDSEIDYEKLRRARDANGNLNKLKNDKLGRGIPSPSPKFNVRGNTSDTSNESEPTGSGTYDTHTRTQTETLSDSDDKMKQIYKARYVNEDKRQTETHNMNYQDKKRRSRKSRESGYDSDSDHKSRKKSKKSRSRKSSKRDKSDASSKSYDRYNKSSYSNYNTTPANKSKSSSSLFNLSNPITIAILFISFIIFLFVIYIIYHFTCKTDSNDDDDDNKLLTDTNSADKNGPKNDDLDDESDNSKPDRHGKRDGKTVGSEVMEPFRKRDTSILHNAPSVIKPILPIQIETDDEKAKKEREAQEAIKRKNDEENAKLLKEIEDGEERARRDKEKDEEIERLRKKEREREAEEAASVFQVSNDSRSNSFYGPSNYSYYYSGGPGRSPGYGNYWYYYDDNDEYQYDDDDGYNAFYGPDDMSSYSTSSSVANNSLHLGWARELTRRRQKQIQEDNLQLQRHYKNGRNLTLNQILFKGLGSKIIHPSLGNSIRCGNFNLELTSDCFLDDTATLASSSSSSWLSLDAFTGGKKEMSPDSASKLNLKNEISTKLIRYVIGNINRLRIHPGTRAKVIYYLKSDESASEAVKKHIEIPIIIDHRRAKNSRAIQENLDSDLGLNLSGDNSRVLIYTAPEFNGRISKDPPSVIANQLKESMIKFEVTRTLSRSRNSEYQYNLYDMPLEAHIGRSRLAMRLYNFITNGRLNNPKSIYKMTGFNVSFVTDGYSSYSSTGLVVVEKNMLIYTATGRKAKGSDTSWTDAVSDWFSGASTNVPDHNSILSMDLALSRNMEVVLEKDFGQIFNEIRKKDTKQFLYGEYFLSCNKTSSSYSMINLGLDIEQTVRDKTQRKQKGYGLEVAAITYNGNDGSSDSCYNSDIHSDIIDYYTALPIYMNKLRLFKLWTFPYSDDSGMAGMYDRLQELLKSISKINFGPGPKSAGTVTTTNTTANQNRLGYLEANKLHTEIISIFNIEHMIRKSMPIESADGTIISTNAPGDKFKTLRPFDVMPESSTKLNLRLRASIFNQIHTVTSERDVNESSPGVLLKQLALASSHDHTDLLYNGGSLSLSNEFTNRRRDIDKSYKMTLISSKAFWDEVKRRMKRGESGSTHKCFIKNENKVIENDHHHPRMGRFSLGGLFSSSFLEVAATEDTGGGGAHLRDSTGVPPPPKGRRIFNLFGSRKPKAEKPAADKKDGEGEEPLEPRRKDWGIVKGAKKFFERGMGAVRSKATDKSAGGGGDRAAGDDGVAPHPAHDRGLGHDEPEEIRLRTPKFQEFHSRCSLHHAIVSVCQKLDFKVEGISSLTPGPDSESDTETDPTRRIRNIIDQANYGEICRRLTEDNDNLNWEEKNNPRKEENAHKHYVLLNDIFKWVLKEYQNAHSDITMRKEELIKTMNIDILSQVFDEIAGIHKYGSASEDRPKTLILAFSPKNRRELENSKKKNTDVASFLTHTGIASSIPEWYIRLLGLNDNVTTGSDIRYKVQIFIKARDCVCEVKWTRDIDRTRKSNVANLKFIETAHRNDINTFQDFILIGTHGSSFHEHKDLIVVPPKKENTYLYNVFENFVKDTKNETLRKALSSQSSKYDSDRNWINPLSPHDLNHWQNTRHGQNPEQALSTLFESDRTMLTADNLGDKLWHQLIVTEAPKYLNFNKSRISESNPAQPPEDSYDHVAKLKSFTKQASEEIFKKGAIQYSANEYKRIEDSQILFEARQLSGKLTQDINVYFSQIFKEVRERLFRDRSNKIKNDILPSLQKEYRRNPSKPMYDDQKRQVLHKYIKHMIRLENLLLKIKMVILQRTGILTKRLEIFGVHGLLDVSLVENTEKGAKGFDQLIDGISMYFIQVNNTDKAHDQSNKTSKTASPNHRHLPPPLLTLDAFKNHIYNIHTKDEFALGYGYRHRDMTSFNVMNGKTEDGKSHLDKLIGNGITKNQKLPAHPARMLRWPSMDYYFNLYKKPKGKV